MPTREDAATIGEALRSVLAQTHDEWEVIVMDDNPEGAAREATEAAVEAVQGEAGGRIRFFKGPGTGQLAELRAALPHVRGHYVTMLHSDDRLVDPGVFDRVVAGLRQSGADGAYSDLVLLDASGQNIGRRTCRWSPALLIASGGSNPLPDVFFTTRTAFEEHVAVNYIAWNTPYYFGIRDGCLDLLNLRREDPPWYGYRLADVPYAATEAGLFDKTNGELRTLAETCRAGLTIAPSFARGHYAVASALDRFALLKVRAESNAGEALGQFRDCTERKRRRLAGHSDSLADYMGRVLSSIHDRASRKAGRPASRELVLDDLHVRDLPIYLGCDAPRFFREVRSSQLAPITARLFEKDYDLIVCGGPAAKHWAEGMMRFLNYLTPVEGLRSADSPDAKLPFGVD